VDLLMQLARVEVQLGRRAAAESTLARACSLDPRSLEPRRRLARLKTEAGRLAEALPVLREAVALAPRDGDSWADFAAAALAADQLDLARTAYLALGRLRPLDVDQAQIAARLLLEAEAAEHFGAAEAWLVTALEQDPSRAGGWRMLAQLRARLDDEEGRLAALRATLEADPADRATLLSLAQARAEREEWERVELLAMHARSLGEAALVESLEALLALRPAPVQAGEDDSQADDSQEDGA